MLYLYTGRQSLSAKNYANTVLASFGYTNTNTNKV